MERNSHFTDAHIHLVTGVQALVNALSKMSDDIEKIKTDIENLNSRLNREQTCSAPVETDDEDDSMPSVYDTILQFIEEKRGKLCNASIQTYLRTLDSFPDCLKKIKISNFSKEDAINIVKNHAKNVPNSVTVLNGARKVYDPICSLISVRDVYSNTKGV